MKKILKKICLVGLSALMLVGCEDMFTADNELVSTDPTPQDTLYQMMGIVQRMQKLATRTILLGEARADLVDVNSFTDEAIRQLSENKVDTLNEYNDPTDYYAVINNCNIYLNYVDSLLTTHGERYYEKEVMAAKTFRAWTYLELAKIYGQVPFVIDPVENSAFAEEAVNFPKKGIADICSYFIEDLKGYAYDTRNNELLPSYNAQFQNESYSKFFIPARVMLAELYLWRGSATGAKQDFVEAVRMYHDFLTFNGEEQPTGINASTWSGYDFKNTNTGYADNFKYNTGKVTVFPMDTIAFYGNTTDLRAVFNSSYKNNYNAMLNPSKRISEISRAQKYCAFRYQNNKADTLYAPTDTAKVTNPMLVGDLRLTSVYKVNSVKDIYHDYNENRQTIAKYNDVSGTTDIRLYYVPLFRYTTLYLHMAEALNHAGFPCTAFAVLKYGLTNQTIGSSSIVPDDEYFGLCEIKSYGLSATGEQTDFTYWGSSQELFQNRVLTTDANVQYDQLGIHSFGSGHSEKNAYYELPHDAAVWAEHDAAEANLSVLIDSLIILNESAPDEEADPEAFEEWLNTVYAPVYDEYLALSDEVEALYAEAKVAQNYEQFVADKILEEEALEGMFEGLRFYDLMRYAMYYNKPDFIAEQVAKRKGEGQTCTAAENLRGGKWYLPLRKR